LEQVHHEVIQEKDSRHEALEQKVQEQYQQLLNGEEANMWNVLARQQESLRQKVKVIQYQFDTMVSESEFLSQQNKSLKPEL